MTERSFFLHFLRIASALLVCISHSKEFFLMHRTGLEGPLELAIRTFMSLGGASVLTFFFLSGFLVGGNELRRGKLNKLNPNKYLLDRLTRLWVVLIPALLFTYFINSITCRISSVSLYCLGDIDLASHSSLPPLSNQNILSFFKSVLFLQPFQGEVFGGNGPLWSLSYEFWYYIFFYTFVLIFFRYRIFSSKNAAPLFLLLCFGALTFLSPNWILLGTIWISGALSHPLIAKLEKIGFTAQYVIFSRKNLFFVAVFFSFSSIVCSLFISRYLSYFVIIVSLVISTLLTSSEKKIDVTGFFRKIIVRGSEMSFSLYLIHFPLLAFFASIWTPVSRLEVGLQSIALLFLLNMICIMSAYLFASVTEFRLKSLRKLFKRFYELR